MLPESYVMSLECQTRISYPFKPSMYKLIRDYHEVDAYLTHYIRKSDTHVGGLLQVYVKRLGHRLGLYGEVHLN